jgi:hypothetical protein
MMRKLSGAIHAFARHAALATLTAALLAGGLTATADAAGTRSRVRLLRSGTIARVVPRPVTSVSYRSRAVAGRRVVRVPVRGFARTARVRPVRVYRSSSTLSDPYCAFTRSPRSTYLGRRLSGYAYRAPIYSPYRGAYAYAATPYGYSGYGLDSRYFSDRGGDLSRGEVARRASRQGYSDGFQRGQYDRRIGTRVPKPTGHGAYQNALNGFDPDWGYALTYRQSYRQAFVHGYASGFGPRAFVRR